MAEMLDSGAIKKNLQQINPSDKEDSLEFQNY